MLKKRLHHSETAGDNTIISKPAQSTSLSIDVSRDTPPTVTDTDCDNTLNIVKTNENHRNASYVTLENNDKFQIPIVAEIHNTNETSLVNNDEEPGIERDEEDVFLKPTSDCEV